MAKYKLIVKESVAKDLRRIPNKDVQQILDRIDDLALNPKPIGVTKLSNQERYRIRQGAYRILYEIKEFELIVTVVNVAHRKSVYR